MKRYVAATLLVVLLAFGGAAMAASAGSDLTPEAALAQLQEGNRRFATGAAKHPRADAARRQETARQGQRPVATVLACSDSRVPPALVFDQGIGDLFVVRVAGNVAGTDALGSLEYGVEHLGTPLVVVLAHTGCGAVEAVAKNAPLTPNMQQLLAPVTHVVQGVKGRFSSAGLDDIMSKSIEANMWQAIADMFAKSPVIRKLAAAGKIKVVGAIYNTDTGAIWWSGEHPSQASLLAK